MSTNESSNFRWVWQGLVVIGILVGLVFAGMKMTGAASPKQSGPKLTYVVKRGKLNVTVIEQGGLESSENIEIKCKVRGSNTVTWVIENGTQVEPGDVLVRLDTLAIEDAINERSKFAHWSRSGAQRSRANLARAKLAVAEYLDGRFVSQVLTLEKNLAIAKSNFSRAQNQLEHAKKLAERGFAHEVQIKQRKTAVDQAELEVDARKTDIEVLEKYTKAMQMKTLEGDLNSAKATNDANEERAMLDEKRRDKAKEEFELCVIKAEKSGLVIFPSAAAWKSSPDVAEGATVHKDQVLLVMPDLMKMQVNVGIHESIVDRITPGMKAMISIPDATLQGEVSSVASVARPAGWWTGNVVKYDTIITLPLEREGLKPGMSAEVEIVIAEHKNVIKVPVSAILDTGEETLCWVMTAGETQRRVIQVGDSNDVYIVILEGLEVGEEVVLNPVAYIKEAQYEAMKTIDESVSGSEEGTAKTSTEQASQKPKLKSKKKSRGVKKLVR